MTEHGALVCTAHVRPHPNADRLKLADVAGYQVVVGDDTSDGRSYALKSKTLAFKVAEGIVKEREDSVDLEEVS